MDLLHPNVRGEIPLPTQALLDAGFESNNAIDWNQLVQDGYNNFYVGYPLTIKDGMIIYKNPSASSSAGRNNGAFIPIDVVTGHVYLWVAPTNFNKYLSVPSGASLQHIGVRTESKGIFTYELTQTPVQYGLQTVSGAAYDINEPLMFIDLTQIFGAGNEPTDIDDPRIKEIESYALNHPDYTTSKQALLQEYINWRNVRGYIYDTQALADAGFEVETSGIIKWRNVRGNLYTLGSLLPYIKHPVFNESVKASELEWVHLGTEFYPHLFRALLPEKVLGNTNVYCDLYTTSSGSVVEDMLDYEIKGAVGSRYVYIKDPRFSKADGSDLKAYLGDTRIWYEKE